MTREAYIREVFETYRLVKVLADKNGAQVLQLRHREQNRDIVLRSLPKPVDAYSALLKVQSMHLPAVWDVISAEDGMLVLEEFIDGLTLAEVMESGRFRKRGAKKVIRQVCLALSVLHTHGIVHRDVKPDNVMITADGRVVLVDLGIAKPARSDRRDTAVMGTVGYAAPEQLGVAKTDERTDVYAVGVLLNVMLTGRHPSEELAGGRMGQIVRKCTAVNPSDRYASADALAAALNGF